MPSSDHRCESCSMPIETGTYCQYCVTSAGDLQSFEERFEKMTEFQMRQKPGLTRLDAERDTLAFMAKMPAWKHHPRLEQEINARR